MPMSLKLSASIGLICLAYVAAAFSSWPFGPIWSFGLTGNFAIHVFAAAAGICASDVITRLSSDHSFQDRGLEAAGVSMGAIIGAAIVMAGLTSVFFYIDVIDASRGRISTLEFLVAAACSLIALFLLSGAVRTAFGDKREQFRHALRRTP